MAADPELSQLVARATKGLDVTSYVMAKQLCWRALAEMGRAPATCRHGPASSFLGSARCRAEIAPDLFVTKVTRFAEGVVVDVDRAPTTPSPHDAPLAIEVRSAGVPLRPEHPFPAIPTISDPAIARAWFAGRTGDAVAVQSPACPEGAFEIDVPSTVSQGAVHHRRGVDILQHVVVDVFRSRASGAVDAVVATVANVMVQAGASDVAELASDERRLAAWTRALVAETSGDPPGEVVARPHAQATLDGIAVTVDDVRRAGPDLVVGVWFAPALMSSLPSCYGPRLSLRSAHGGVRPSQLRWVWGREVISYAVHRVPAFDGSSTLTAGHGAHAITVPLSPADNS